MDAVEMCALVSVRRGTQHRKAANMPKLLTSAVLLALAGSGAHAVDLVLDTDAGLLSVGGGPFAQSVTFNGTEIRGSIAFGGVRRYLVFGDLEVNGGDRVSAVSGSSLGVRLLVGNDVVIASGAAIDVSAQGSFGRAGGGDGGEGGQGGAGGEGGAGGAGGPGGAEALAGWAESD